MVAAAVAACLRSWGSSGVRCGCSSASKDGGGAAAIEHMEAVLGAAACAVSLEAHRLTLPQLQARLRGAPALQRRVRALSRLRNAVAHPDVGLPEAVASYLGGEGKAELPPPPPLPIEAGRGLPVSPDKLLMFMGTGAQLAAAAQHLGALPWPRPSAAGCGKSPELGPGARDVNSDNHDGLAKEVLAAQGGALPCTPLPVEPASVQVATPAVAATRGNDEDGPGGQLRPAWAALAPAPAVDAQQVDDFVQNVGCSKPLGLRTLIVQIAPMVVELLRTAKLEHNLDPNLSQVSLDFLRKVQGLMIDAG